MVSSINIDWVVKSPFMAFYSAESEKRRFPFPHESITILRLWIRALMLERDCNSVQVIDLGALNGRIDDFLRSHQNWLITKIEAISGMRGIIVMDQPALDLKAMRK